MKPALVIAFLIAICPRAESQVIFDFLCAERWDTGSPGRLRVYFPPQDAIYFADLSDDYIVKKIPLDGVGGVATLNPTLPHNIDGIYVIGDYMYIVAGNGIWQSDGTASGTTQIRNFPTASGLLLDEIDGTLYARVEGGVEQGMWVMRELNGESAAGIATLSLLGAGLAALAIWVVAKRNPQTVFTTARNGIAPNIAGYFSTQPGPRART